jgi:hypothetical protein
LSSLGELHYFNDVTACEAIFYGNTSTTGDMARLSHSTSIFFLLCVLERRQSQQQASSHADQGKQDMKNLKTTIEAQQRWEENQVPPGVPFRS